MRIKYGYHFLPSTFHQFLKIIQPCIANILSRAEIELVCVFILSKKS